LRTGLARRIVRWDDDRRRPRVHHLAGQSDGRVAIVTGGTRGIGAEIARTLLAAGCEVAVCGRTEPSPTDLPAADGRTAAFWPCDVRKADAVADFVDAVGRRFGRIDILVNNAGGSPPADAATVSPRFHEAIVALNLMAPIHMSQAVAGWMNRRLRGGEGGPPRPDAQPRGRMGSPHPRQRHRRRARRHRLRPGALRVGGRPRRHRRVASGAAHGPPA
jgi:NAD(P)-dependent dehydrogenase (short-subunit alcohol dehydrogenase family)